MKVMTVAATARSMRMRTAIRVISPPAWQT